MSEIGDSDQALSSDELERLLELQQKILELIALTIDYSKPLSLLCELAEEMVPGSIASVMMLDKKTGTLNVYAAPSISAEAIAMLNGLVPGPNAGSCGNAIYQQQAVFVADAKQDERWRDKHAFAKTHQIGSCWAMPLHSSSQRIVGTFALSRKQTGLPAAFEQKLLDVCAHIAGIAISRCEAENQLAYAAFHDELTGLPNRRLLMERLEHALATSRKHQQRGALMLLDLDRFKHINDIHGHQFGDRLLQLIARRLREIIDDDITLARFTGDEFALLIENIESPADLEHIGQYLLNSFKSAFSLDGHEFFIMASLGICIYPADGHTASILLSHADAAMYQAKAEGRNQLCFYQSNFTSRAQKALNLEQDIRRALAHNQFELHYQPQVNASTGQLVGVEALIRWQHPELGMISPDDFIPIAEDTGLINDIGEWVTDQACRQLMHWQRSGHHTLQVAVNLSGRQLDQGHVGNLESIVREHGVNPACIEFELTESYVMRHAERAAGLLERIRNMGASLAVDDFGIGYSSLAYLKRLPINKLKIDRSLVRDITSDHNDKLITSAVISLGQSLGLTVLAEGVECIHQQAFLANEGCNYLQGYLFGKPQPASQIQLLLPPLAAPTE